MLFRDGLILAMTEEVKPSALPITFGSILKVPTAPYALRNIKIYSSPLFPTGFDASADRMRYCSGPGYAMQRVSIKDPTLPRILVAGDSISMGYRGFISEAFKGRAYVDYWVGGGWFECQHASHVERRAGKMLGEELSGQYDPGGRAPAEDRSEHQVYLDPVYALADDAGYRQAIVGPRTK